MSHIFWKLLIWRFIWYIWGPSTCILWPVRFFVTLWFATGSISWNHVLNISLEPGYIWKQKMLFYFSLVTYLCWVVVVESYTVSLVDWIWTTLQCWKADARLAAFVDGEDSWISDLVSHKLTCFYFSVFRALQSCHYNDYNDCNDCNDYNDYNDHNVHNDFNDYNDSNLDLDLDWERFSELVT